jgi:hypothetical protein
VSESRKSRPLTGSSAFKNEPWESGETLFPMLAHCQQFFCAQARNNFYQARVRTAISFWRIGLTRNSVYENKSPARGDALLLSAYQSLVNALSNGEGNPALFDSIQLGLGRKLTNPQAGFGTFGGPHIATLLCEVSTRALHAVWYQKWMVHRRLRPEAFASRIEYNRTPPGRFDVHNSINSSTVLAAVKQHNEQFNGVGLGTYLLPLAFPRGARRTRPTVPATRRSPAHARRY